MSKSDNKATVYKLRRDPALRRNRTGARLLSAAIPVTDPAMSEWQRRHAKNRSAEPATLVKPKDVVWERSPLYTMLVQREYAQKAYQIRKKIASDPDPSALLANANLEQEEALKKEGKPSEAMRSFAEEGSVLPKPELMAPPPQWYLPPVLQGQWVGAALDEPNVRVLPRLSDIPADATGADAVTRQLVEQGEALFNIDALAEQCASLCATERDAIVMREGAEEQQMDEKLTTKDFWLKELKMTRLYLTTGPEITYEEEGLPVAPGVERGKYSVVLRTRPPVYTDAPMSVRKLLNTTYATGLFVQMHLEETRGMDIPPTTVEMTMPDQTTREVLGRKERLIQARAMGIRCANTVGSIDRGGALAGSTQTVRAFGSVITEVPYDNQRAQQFVEGGTGTGKSTTILAAMAGSRQFASAHTSVRPGEASEFARRFPGPTVVIDLTKRQELEKKPTKPTGISSYLDSRPRFVGFDLAGSPTDYLNADGFDKAMRFAQSIVEQAGQGSSDKNQVFQSYEKKIASMLALCLTLGAINEVQSRMRGKRHRIPVYEESNLQRLNQWEVVIGGNVSAAPTDRQPTDNELVSDQLLTSYGADLATYGFGTDVVEPANYEDWDPEDLEAKARKVGKPIRPDQNLLVHALPGNYAATVDREGTLLNVDNSVEGGPKAYYEDVLRSESEPQLGLAETLLKILLGEPDAAAMTFINEMLQPPDGSEPLIELDPGDGKEIPPEDIRSESFRLRLFQTVADRILSEAKRPATNAELVLARKVLQGATGKDFERAATGDLMVADEVVDALQEPIQQVQSLLEENPDAQDSLMKSVQFVAKPILEVLRAAGNVRSPDPDRVLSVQEWVDGDITIGFEVPDKGEGGIARLLEATLGEKLGERAKAHSDLAGRIKMALSDGRMQGDAASILRALEPAGHIITMPMELDAGSPEALMRLGIPPEPMRLVTRALHEPTTNPKALPPGFRQAHLYEASVYQLYTAVSALGPALEKLGLANDEADAHRILVLTLKTGPTLKQVAGLTGLRGVDEPERMPDGRPIMRDKGVGPLMVVRTFPEFGLMQVAHRPDAMQIHTGDGSTKGEVQMPPRISEWELAHGYVPESIWGGSADYRLEPGNAAPQLERHGWLVQPTKPGTKGWPWRHGAVEYINLAMPPPFGPNDKPKNPLIGDEGIVRIQVDYDTGGIVLLPPPDSRSSRLSLLRRSVQREPSVPADVGQLVDHAQRLVGMLEEGARLTAVTAPRLLRQLRLSAPASRRRAVAGAQKAPDLVQSELTEADVRRMLQANPEVMARLARDFGLVPAAEPSSSRGGEAERGVSDEVVAQRLIEVIQSQAQRPGLEGPDEEQEEGEVIRVQRNPNAASQLDGRRPDTGRPQPRGSGRRPPTGFGNGRF